MLLNNQLSLKLKLPGFGYNTNIMSLTSSLMCDAESNKPNRVLYRLSNQQMGNKLQRVGSNPRPPSKLGSGTQIYPTAKFSTIQILNDGHYFPQIPQTLYSHITISKILSSVEMIIISVKDLQAALLLE